MSEEEATKAAEAAKMQELEEKYNALISCGKKQGTEGLKDTIIAIKEFLNG